YHTLLEARRRDWAALWVPARGDLPYLPAVATGWDATPRGTRDWDGRRMGFPFTPVVEGASPDAVAAAVAAAVDFLDPRDPSGELPAFSASWNEWSESHRLEPCLRHGDAHLRAIGAALAPRRLRRA